MPPRQILDIVVISVVAIRIEAALKHGGVSKAAQIGAVHVGMDGSSATPGAATDAGLSRRELEKLDVAWRLLRHGPFNGTCLRRAIVGGYLLRRHDPILRIGVAKSDGVVSAHAWIDVGGVSLDPEGSQRFAILNSPT